MVSISLLFEKKRLYAASPFGAKIISGVLSAQISLLVLRPNRLFFFFNSHRHENMLTIQNEPFLFQYSIFSTIYKIVEK